MALMKRCRPKGNILPFMIILMGSLLVVSTLLLKHSQGRLERSHLKARHLRLHTLVFHQAEMLRRYMETQIESGVGTSALIAQPGMNPKHFSSFWIRTQTERDPLHSVWNSNDSAGFERLDGHSFLNGDWIPLGGNGSDGLAIAWSFEDLGLEDTRAPPFWPLKTLAPAPVSSAGQINALQKLWESGLPESAELWSPYTEPLLFRPSLAPAMVPVLESVALRFSIFASGPVRSREKVIRIRYFIEGILWNPYNRDMRLHSGSAIRPAFQMSVEGLPRVRVHNLSRGIRTGWIDLDRSTNDQSQVTGISAWIDVPSMIGAGESLAFTAPRPERQEEGLARTLHRGFLLGPADRIQLEFENAGPVRIRAYTLNDLPSQGIEEGPEEWAHLEAFGSWPEIFFQRADAGDRPFYLPDGSLSFNGERAYATFEVHPLLSRYNPTVDPRRQIASPHSLSAHQRAGYLIDLRKDPPTLRPLPPPFALYSWPESPPATLLAATDLPWFDGAYRAGWPYSDRNYLLNHPAAWDHRLAATLRPPTAKEWLPYAPCLPVNCIDPGAWHDALTASGERIKEDWCYPAYATVNPSEKRDFAIISDQSLQLAAKALAERAALDPVASIADFFHQNRPLSALGLPIASPDQVPAYAPQGLPLNALFRKAPVPVRHSAAWLLHVAARHNEGASSQYLFARFWFLQSIDQSTGEPTLNLIHADSNNRPMLKEYPNQFPSAPNGQVQKTEPQPRPA